MITIFIYRRALQLRRWLCGSTVEQEKPLLLQDPDAGLQIANANAQRKDVAIVDWNRPPDLRASAGPLSEDPPLARGQRV